MNISVATTAGSGVFVGLLGVAYYTEIHHIAYFIVVQIFVGVFEVSVSIVYLYSLFTQQFHLIVFIWGG